jgi:YfiR/HmsC-like
MGVSVHFRFAYGLTTSVIEGCVCLPRLFTGLGVGQVSVCRAPKRRFSIRKPIRGLVFFVLLTTLVLPLPAWRGREERLNEYQEKASFLAAFPKFVEWPPDAFSAEQSPLLLCVFGDFSFGTSLIMATRGTSIRGRRVEVRWTRKEQDLRACHILFVSRSEGKRYGSIFKSIQGASVLTVGETSDFLASGGAIDFLIAEDKLQFEVNMGAASDAHLRISSNMLALARHVITRAEAAKS